MRRAKLNLTREQARPPLSLYLTGPLPKGGEVARSRGVSLWLRTTPFGKALRAMARYPYDHASL